MFFAENLCNVSHGLLKRSFCCEVPFDLIIGLHFANL